MTEARMNQLYGTEESEAFCQPAWFVIFNKRTQKGRLVTYGSYWSWQDYEDGSYFNEHICASLDECFLSAMSEE